MAFESSSFSGAEYVKTEFEFETPGKKNEFLLKHLADFYTKGPSSVVSGGLRILDYGCGPSLPFSISAASKASEIVLADYSAPNREYWQKWLDRDGSSQHNWTPYFEYVVQALEGRSADAEEAKQREDELRCKVKAVVSCDICKDDFIDERHTGAYDVVMSFLCLDSAAEDLPSYQSFVPKLVSLVRKGGYLLFLSDQRENCDVGYFVIDDVEYPTVVLKRNVVVQTLEQNGLFIETEEYLPVLTPDLAISNNEGFLFISACKV